MWEFLLGVIGSIIAMIIFHLFIKRSLPDKVNLKEYFDFSNILFLGSILWYYFKRMVKHPLYNKIGISINALQLLVSAIYGFLGSLSLVLKGHSINYAMIPFIIIMAVSINLFYQSVKLYR